MWRRLGTGDGAIWELSITFSSELELIGFFEDDEMYRG